MTEQSGKAMEISLGDDFGDVAVKVNGICVEVHTDGSILVHTNGNAKVCPVANDDSKAATSSEPKIGDKMPDGTIYAGISPETNKPMYAMPADAPLTMTFNEAREYAAKGAKFKAYGHQDWRVPTKVELNVLFNNRSAIGGFNLTNSLDGRNFSNTAGCYWSASQTFFRAWSQRFSEKGGCGDQFPDDKDVSISLRCIR